ncbi:Transmembrane protein 19 [Psilocybe cubensis]|uniref:Transmembrane protein 19 n=2 Tax=Psilocybe cubensis TaxID=181762 RepID=A0ACB8GI38_PSICU|nr:Transmembrane protein 19 [Psilocybe cubensis]KAH9475375.1 Transmembrane protein 19 [Psilocybe cubensis]
MQIPFVSGVLALLLSAHGLRRKSLSPSGAFAALVVGFLMMAGGTSVFGVALIGFYLVGSRATKYGKNRKAKLEEGYQEGGYRSGWQVLCNSASALVAAIVWNAAMDPRSVQAAVTRTLLGLDMGGTVLGLRGPVVYGRSSGGWCPTERTVADGWSRALVFAALGHFACCLGDTLASELGILSPSPPRLITTLKTVPPGTNGAMSVGGTVASIAGGGIVGALMGAALVLENGQCGRGAVFELVAWGMCGGGIGSLVDSFLGATVQQTRYSTKSKVVLQDASKADGRVISGLNILTNNQVNLASSVFCAVMAAWLAARV